MNIKNIVLKSFCIFMLITILVSMICSINAIAASYNGSGTKQDPYIVQTPEQLDGIRNNLTANYKLGNTIDMSSFGNLFQIGNLANPFKGSFTCDVDATGKPLYCITGLKVYNAAGEKAGHKLHDSKSYSDYSKNNSKWETGLFGTTQDANFENIYIINSDITCTVLGQHQQNPDFTWNPGTGEQGTGVFVGIAINTFFSNCATSGVITAKNNSTGGFAGELRGSIVEKCWADVNVNSTGFWCTGGFAGSVSDNTTIDSSAALGNVSATGSESTSVGGFVGSASEVMITNSYCKNSVNICCAFSGTSSTASTFSECYSDTVVQNPSIPSKANGVAENSYSLSGTTIERNFTVADASAIKSAFSSNSKWDISGDLPVIVGMNIVNDVASFGSAEIVAPSAQQSQNSSDSSAANSSEQSTLSGTEKIEKFKQLMDKIADPEKVTLDDKDSIKEARDIFENLSDSEYNDLPAEYIQKYNTAYKTLCLLLLSDIANRIEELPDVSKLTIKDKEKVESIYNDYLFLNDDTRNMLSQTLQDKLEAAYNAVENMDDTAVTTSSRPLTTSEKIIVAVLIFLILCVLSFHTLVIIYLQKRNGENSKNNKDEIITQEE